MSQWDIDEANHQRRRISEDLEQIRDANRRASAQSGDGDDGIDIKPKHVLGCAIAIAVAAVIPIIGFAIFLYATGIFGEIFKLL